MDIPIEKGQSYQWYYDRLIKLGYNEAYARNEAQEQFMVWGGRGDGHIN